MKRKRESLYNAGAYPRFKNWGTNHGEREERGAEGVGVRRGCLLPNG